MSTQIWTPQRVWRFGDRLHAGKRGEEAVYDAFCDDFLITPVMGEAQRSPWHFDSYWTPRSEPHVTLKVEVTTDFGAEEHGNVFLETLSVDAGEVREPGKCLLSRAELIAHYLPHLGEVLLFRTGHVRRHIVQLSLQYGESDALNDGYQSRGVPVPIPVAKNLAWRTRELGGGEREVA